MSETQGIRIRLTVDVPVWKEHGMTKGRVFEVVEQTDEDGVKVEGTWVPSANGVDVVKLHRREYEVVNDDEPA